MEGGWLISSEPKHTFWSIPYNALVAFAYQFHSFLPSDHDLQVPEVPGGYQVTNLQWLYTFCMLPMIIAWSWFCTQPAHLIRPKYETGLSGNPFKPTDDVMSDLFCGQSRKVHLWNYLAEVCQFGSGVFKYLATTNKLPQHMAAMAVSVPLVVPPW